MISADNLNGNKTWLGIKLYKLDEEKKLVLARTKSSNNHLF